MYSYDTASQAINDLIKRGYSVDFNLDEDKDVLVAGSLRRQLGTVVLSPDEFIIDEIYRFEGNSDPADEAVVYAISSPKHNIKGILVNAYGPYSNSQASAIVRKLSAHIMLKAS